MPHVPCTAYKLQPQGAAIAIPPLVPGQLSPELDGFEDRLYRFLLSGTIIFYFVVLARIPKPSSV